MSKRIFDIFFSTLGVVALTPFFLPIFLLIKLDSPGPVFFRQLRVGQYQRLFRIFKLRTMLVNAESIGPNITISNDNRITPLGRLLRKYKLDELPQLLNVLMGHMSLVGPRPEVLDYVKHYTEKQRKVLTIKPGITEYASIKFLNEGALLEQSEDAESTYLEQILPEKLKLNLKYIEKSCFFSDLKIIFFTLGALKKGALKATGNRIQSIG